MLKSANDNTERRAGIGEKRSRDYTDECSANTPESTNTYTNHRVVQAGNNAVAWSNNYTITVLANCVRGWSTRKNA